MHLRNPQVSANVWPGRPIGAAGRAQLPLCRARSAQPAEQQLQVANAPKFRVGFKLEQGLRGTMEDEVDVEVNEQHGYVFTGVYDGHGGGAAAAWLKANLYDRIKVELESHGHHGFSASNTQVADGLDAAFKAIDATLLDYLEKQGGEELAQAGSTATVVMVWPDRVVAANVGDSQAYSWRKSKLVPLTTPHRVYGGGPEMEHEVARVKSVGGWVYDGRVCNVLAVSRAFGDWEFKGRGLERLVPAGVERGYWDNKFANSVKFTGDPVIVTPDSCDLPVTEEDEFVVVASDGLWDVFPPREAMQWARKELQRGYTPQEVSESLVGMALKRYTSDNTSVVVVDLKGEEYWHAFASKTGRGGGLFGALFGGR